MIDTQQIAPVVFSGIQSGFGLMDDFSLWTLTEDMAGYPKGTTLSTDTLHKLGYITPNEQIAQEVQQVRQRMKESFNPWAK